MPEAGMRRDDEEEDRAVAPVLPVLDRRHEICREKEKEGETQMTSEVRKEILSLFSGVEQRLRVLHHDLIPEHEVYAQLEGWIGNLAEIIREVEGKPMFVVGDRLLDVSDVSVSSLVTVVEVDEFVVFMEYEDGCRVTCSIVSLAAALESGQVERIGG